MRNMIRIFVVFVAAILSFATAGRAHAQGTTGTEARPAPASETSDATNSGGTAQGSTAEKVEGSSAGTQAGAETRPGTAARPAPREAAPAGTEAAGTGASGEGKTRSSRPEARAQGAGKARPTGGTKAGKPACPCPTVAKKVAAKPKKKKQGWIPKLKAGLNTSLVYNKNIPGIDDGLTFTLGLVLTGSLQYLRGPHSWTTDLKVVETLSKTPTVEPWLKTADEMRLATTYKYEFPKYKKLNVFGTAQLSAPLFRGDLVPSADTDLVLVHTDGTTEADQAAGNERYLLTKSFSPLVLKQLLGLGVTPNEEPIALLNLKLSFAAEEVWASGYSVNDDSSTVGLDLTELQNYQQVGAQLNVLISGTVKKRLKYALAAEFMFPVYTSVETDLKGFDLLNADLSFKVGVQVASWASVDYVFSAKRMPMIVRQWQVLNNLVLSVTANIL